MRGRYEKTAAAPSPAVQTRVMRVAQQSARHKDMVSLIHRNIQRTAQYPETFPNAVQSGTNGGY